MSEETTMNELCNGKWKAKSGREYVINWCYLCDCAGFSCLEKDCHGSTCNCGGCDICGPDQDEFREYKTSIYNYLTDEEMKVYEKCLRIKKHILETIPEGMKEIDFKFLDKEGKLSQNERVMFEKELK